MNSGFFMYLSYQAPKNSSTKETSKKFENVKMEFLPTSLYGSDILDELFEPTWFKQSNPDLYVASASSWPESVILHM